MYERLSKLKSPNGVTVDKCIQPSVDNKGDIIGLVAGDPECYEVRPSVRPSVCVSVCLSVCPSVCLSVTVTEL